MGYQPGARASWPLGRISAFAVDASVGTSDMEDQVSFAVCVNVEWPIDLIKGGGAKSAMTYGDCAAHLASPLAVDFSLRGSPKPSGNASARLARGCKPRVGAVMGPPPPALNTRLAENGSADAGTLADRERGEPRREDPT